MAQAVNEQGKYFTDRIRKQEMRVVIRTQSSRIEGVIHLHPEHRLLDELNQVGSSFVAITEATIYAEGKETSLSFLALRKDSIEWAFPIDELIEDIA